MRKEQQRALLQAVKLTVERVDPDHVKITSGAITIVLHADDVEDLVAQLRHEGFCDEEPR